MSVKTTLLAAGLLAFALPAYAADAIMVMEPYARSSGASAKSGAAFMQIMNKGDADDRLVSASSDVAGRVELHTHKEGENGVVQMRHVPEGFELPAGDTLSLERGGKHVMFMGLTAPFEDGATVNVTLTFEKAGDVQIEIPVDLKRMPGHGAGHGTDSDDS